MKLFFWGFSIYARHQFFEEICAMGACGFPRISPQSDDRIIKSSHFRSFLISNFYAWTSEN